MHHEPSASINRLSHDAIGAAIEVHRHLGPGFLESIYEEAVAHELGLRGINVHRQVVVPILYKDRLVGEGRLDLFIEGGLVVELKAIETVLPIHVAQVISYLRATHAPLGLLINFNVRRLRDGIQRIAYDPARYAPSPLEPAENPS